MLSSFQVLFKAALPPPQISVLSPVSQRGLVGPKPGLRIQGVVKQMLDRAAIGSSCMAIKLAIDEAGLSPSLCTDFINVGRPVQSGCYPDTKIFMGTDSF